MSMEFSRHEYCVVLPFSIPGDLPNLRIEPAYLAGWEDLLEKEMATDSSTLAWKIPWMEEPGRLQSMGLQRLDMTEQLHFHFLLH